MILAILTRRTMLEQTLTIFTHEKNPARIMILARYGYLVIFGDQITFGNIFEDEMLISKRSNFHIICEWGT